MDEHLSGKILIIEDEQSIRGFLKVVFADAGFCLSEAESGEAGIEKAQAERPDVIILDVMLPGIDGFTVCQELRQKYPDVGIIMLTARTQDVDKIKGLEFGADDYVIKPFNPTELLLRVRVLLRRMHNGQPPCRENVIEFKPFTLDLEAHELSKNGCLIEITPTEFLLMKLFLEHPGKAFSRDELLDLVWGEDFFGDTKIVDVNIGRLRKKIEEQPASPVYLVTVWGYGYRWGKVKVALGSVMI